jgi:hypothetical protein
MDKIPKQLARILPREEGTLLAVAPVLIDTAMVPIDLGAK